MNYRPYNKRAFCNRFLSGTMVKTANIQKTPSFWNVSKWPEWWEAGAKELEKTAPGQIITAPVRLPAAVLTSAEKTVKEVPGTVSRLSKTLPFLAIAGIVIGGGYYANKAGFFKKIRKSIQSST